jgi:Beta protein
MHTTLLRKPTFGDFTIRDPGPPADFGAPSANLRYTKARDWLVIIGGRVNAGGSQDMYNFCDQLINMPEFDGPNFSAGDAAIFRTATRISGPGNATQWVQWCMNHHIEFVAAQIRNHPAI